MGNLHKIFESLKENEEQEITVGIGFTPVGYRKDGKAYIKHMFVVEATDYDDDFNERIANCSSNEEAEQILKDLGIEFTEVVACGDNDVYEGGYIVYTDGKYEPFDLSVADTLDNSLETPEELNKPEFKGIDALNNDQ